MLVAGLLLLVQVIEQAGAAVYSAYQTALIPERYLLRPDNGNFIPWHAAAVDKERKPVGSPLPETQFNGQIQAPLYLVNGSGYVCASPSLELDRADKIFRPSYRK